MPVDLQSSGKALDHHAQELGFNPSPHYYKAKAKEINNKIINN